MLKQFSLLFYLFLFSGYLFVNVYPQIPINGFCKFSRIEAEKGYQKIFPLNYNNDSYTDIILLNSLGKTTAVYNGEPVNLLTKARVNRTSYEISSLVPAGGKIAKNIHVFTSRKSRTVGLTEISTTGRLRILSSTKILSYPENFSSGDIDKDSIDEFLAAGSSFYGLSIFNINGIVIRENKIFTDQVYSSAVFVDLNNDKYPDIAAFNLLRNKLEFFYNNTAGSFRKVKEYSFPGSISILHPYDLNLDGNQDLIISVNDSIHILYGDHYSSYRKIQSIKTSLVPDKLITADFNRDGFIDIGYLNKECGQVNILFGRDAEHFYPEIIYLKKQNLVDLIPFYSRFINGFLAYSSDGEIYLVNRIKVIDDDTRISLGVLPSCISYFDAWNNKIYDICYFDRYLNTLNLIVRNSAGTPNKFYSIKLLDIFDKIITDEKNPQIKTFYCFSKNKRLIEIINVDLGTDKIIKDKIYSAGNINDIKIEPQEDNKAKIYVVFDKAGELGFSIFEFKNFRYVETVSKGLAKNVFDAHLLIGNAISIFYWEEGKNSYLFNKIILDRQLKPAEYNTKFSISPGDNTKIITFTGDLYNNEKDQAASFIFSNDKNVAVFTTDSESNIINLKRILSDLKINYEKELFFGESRFDGIKKLYVYNSNAGYVEKISILGKNQILLNKLVECQNLESYFIKNLNFRNYHVVYIDKKECCITIKELK